MKEAAGWSAFYIGMALLCGVVIGLVYGWNFGGEYFAGWVTEWSLSLDNLFVFIIIMAAFRVPKELQQKVLAIGIAMALVFRLIFILLGAALINNFAWVFYIFGIFLIFTAIQQVRAGIKGDEDEEYQEALFTRMMRKVFPITEGFVGDKFLHRHAGKTYLTPLLLVVIAIGSADVMFAVDSIPAIFGLTKESFIVFAANAFALLGLRQLYFLIGGLLQRLIYLHYGLAAILGFIGVKLLIHALHENEVPFINGGEPIHWLPEPTIPVSLGVIVGVLVVTAVLSIVVSRVRARREEDVETPEEVAEDIQEGEQPK